MGGGLQLGIRLYVKDLNNRIVEHCYDGDGWFEGGFPPVYGADFACTSYTKKHGKKDQYSLRLYVVSNEGVLVEHCFDGDGWYIGELGLGGVDSVSATAWTTGTSNIFSATAKTPHTCACIRRKAPTSDSWSAIGTGSGRMGCLR